MLVSLASPNLLAASSSVQICVDMDLPGGGTVGHRAAGHPAQRDAFQTPLCSTADNLLALHEGRCVQHEEQRHEECRD
jgi:hypothetical protein